jgi:hypothetical protein
LVGATQLVFHVRNALLQAFQAQGLLHLINSRLILQDAVVVLIDLRISLTLLLPAHFPADYF